MSMCLLLLLIALSSHTQVSVALRNLLEHWASYRNECIQSFRNSPPAAGMVCNRTFDNYACWPDGMPGSVVNVSCPWYLPWHQNVLQGHVYRGCGTDGQWAVSKNTTECEENNPGIVRYPECVCVCVCCRELKLHCTRNNIHMNLFTSFILRAISILVKDGLLDIINNMVAGCRTAMVMMQYTVIANNYWLLVEGLYLHSLLAITVFSERKYFYIYLCIGWGAPVIFVLPWVTAKYLYENEQCWERNINMGYWWIIRSPIIFAYLINFFIFIKIIKILMSKLKAHQMRYTDYKFRLAKSTLTLIPLLGIHAILFTFVIDESVSKESLLRLIRLFYDLLFSSFQMLLFCVQVQNEMLKRWRRWKLGKDIDEEYRHTHSQTAHGKSSSAGLAVAPEHSDTPEPTDPMEPLPPSEESRCLVVRCHNGTGGERRRGQAVLQLAFQPQGDTSNCSSLTEDTCLDERLHGGEDCLAVMEECDV
uniref:Glucagon receptor b n=1 Tax=Electrophorus electricus TaxID=8005 RepID=A0AAY5EGX2_ELEEL